MQNDILSTHINALSESLRLERMPQLAMYHTGRDGSVCENGGMIAMGP